MTDLERLQVQAETIANLERGIRGADGIWPDWVYETREAIRHRDQNVPWLPDLMAVLGWQGGTVHQVIQAVKRLVAAEVDRELNGWKQEGP